jgi:sulfonate transport system permease protein
VTDVTLQAAPTGLATAPATPRAAGPEASAPESDLLAVPDAAGLVRLATGDPVRRPRRWSVALRLLLPASVFAAWWILTSTAVIPSTTLAGPGATWDAFVELWRHQDLLGDIGVSARRAALGLALGAGVGLILGIVVGLTRLGEELFDASMQMLRMVPYPAVIFLFIIWFGIGEMAKVLLIGLATLFPMYLNTSNGVRNVDRRVVEAARAFGVEGWQLVRRVVVPLAMPSIMTGLRFSAGISVIALVFTESIGANQGIGYLVAQADSLQQIPVLVVCVVIYALLGIAADLSVRLLERVTMPWRRHQAVR